MRQWKVTFRHRTFPWATEPYIGPGKVALRQGTLQPAGEGCNGPGNFSLARCNVATAWGSLHCAREVGNGAENFATGQGTLHRPREVDIGLRNVTTPQISLRCLPDAQTRSLPPRYLLPTHPDGRRGCSLPYIYVRTKRIDGQVRRPVRPAGLAAHVFIDNRSTAVNRGAVRASPPAGCGNGTDLHFLARRPGARIAP